MLARTPALRLISARLTYFRTSTLEECGSVFSTIVQMPHTIPLYCELWMDQLPVSFSVYLHNSKKTFLIVLGNTNTSNACTAFTHAFLSMKASFISVINT
uniref:AlNc14C227G9234 protein n=1 Tax=Albugo laibachii Nc14 TaxID=890382 RepID=F0WS95_9STRA|nr:AlNc14C227G9234 [Albugo laibachii Nc14]CCA26936.1 AlNc14C433G11603 [Albugo laibachii Nc14]|eukprot:CCA26936.1 AlNc14C433G11603 [Albugo laibachii Nc14]